MEFVHFEIESQMGDHVTWSTLLVNAEIAEFMGQAETFDTKEAAKAYIARYFRFPKYHRVVRVVTTRTVVE